MRALRVVGLADDGKTVICEDVARNERFTIPADERLRAAARGDVTRLGQIEIELESQMRPREIQSRIRAGESVAQIAALSGLPENRIERYAYPVLLERSRTAELAQRAHPVREDGPDVQTLGEVVAHSFGLRGQDYSTVVWDSWRGDDGKWVVQMSWTAGRSDNQAHFSFHPGAHGGTVAALDEQAVDLLDPNPNRPLRTVRPVTELAQQALELNNPRPTSVQPVERPMPVAAQAAQVVEPEPDPEPEPVLRTEQQPQFTEQFVDDFELAEEVAEPVQVAEPEPAPEPVVAEEPSEQELPMDPAPAAAQAEQPAASRRPKSKKARPIVPSWEDVLLGTRSNRG